MKLPFRGDYKLTQSYGVNPELYKRFGLAGHNGLDHAVPCATELYAMISGKVIEATFDEGGYGNYIKIENDKEGALIAHLSKLAVKAGDTVKEGETYIGNSVTTGNSTGCHTHTGYYRKPRDRGNGYAGYIDPTPYLQQQEPMATITQKELDSIIKARDSHWNDLQNEKKETEQLRVQIAELNKTIETYF